MLILHFARTTDRNGNNLQRDLKEYFADANFEPHYEKVTLEEAKKLFGKHQYQII